MTRNGARRGTGEEDQTRDSQPLEIRLGSVSATQRLMGGALLERRCLGRQGHRAAPISPCPRQRRQASPRGDRAPGGDEIPTSAEEEHRKAHHKSPSISYLDDLRTRGFSTCFPSNEPAQKVESWVLRTLFSASRKSRSSSDFGAREAAEVKALIGFLKKVTPSVFWSPERRDRASINLWVLVIAAPTQRRPSPSPPNRFKA